MAGIPINIVVDAASLTNGETVLPTERLVANVRVLIISKLFVVQRLLQAKQHRALTEIRDHHSTDGCHPLGATMAKEEASSPRRGRPRSLQSRKHTP